MIKTCELKLKSKGNEIFIVTCTWSSYLDKTTINLRISDLKKIEKMVKEISNDFYYKPINNELILSFKDAISNNMAKLDLNFNDYFVSWEVVYEY